MTLPWLSRGVTLGCLIGLLTACTARMTSAEVRWGLGRWQGEGTFYLDWENQDDKNSHTKYETILFQERVGLRNVGAFIVDPRFLTLNLGGSFGLSQEEGLSVSDSPLRVGNGTLYDYAFDGLLLSDSEYPVTLFAVRNQNILTQGFGGQSDVTYQSEGGTVELREGSILKDYGLLNLSSFLDVHREYLKEDSEVFGSPFRQDQTRNIVRYTAHKGGETSDLDLRYEFNDVNDDVNPTNVFDSHTVRLGHSVDFGPTLNRRLDSIVYYFTRDGSAGGSYLSLDEGLRLDHQRDLSTDYRYNFTRSDSDAGLTTTNAATVGLLYRLYQQLLTTAGARGMRQEFPTGDETIGSAQTGLDYYRPLAWSGQLYAGTSAGYQVNDNNFTSSEIEVVDEPHTAPPVLGAGAGFTLDNAFVVTDTIVMVDVRGGARLPTTLGVDYALSPQGSLTKIIPLPGSPVIRPGDPLEVSYTYAVDPSVTFSTTTVTARTGVDFAWVAASYEHLFSDQGRLAGTATPGFLINQNLDRFTFELRHQWNAVYVRSALAYEILRSTIVDSNAWRFGQQLSYQARVDLSAQITGEEYLVDYPGQGRQSNSYLVRGSVDWVAPIGLSMSTFTGYREFHDTAVPSDEIVDAGVRARWTFQNLEIMPSFTWADYIGRLNDLRAELRLTRRWF